MSKHFACSNCWDNPCTCGGAKSDLRDAIVSLHPKPGDIWVVDASQVDVDSLSQMKIPELAFSIPVIVAFPRGAATLDQAIRTCDLDMLKRVVAEMEREKTFPLTAPPRGATLPSMQQQLPPPAKEPR